MLHIVPFIDYNNYNNYIDYNGRNDELINRLPLTLLVGRYSPERARGGMLSDTSPAHGTLQRNKTVVWASGRLMIKVTGTFSLSFSCISTLSSLYSQSPSHSFSLSHLFITHRHCHCHCHCHTHTHTYASTHSYTHTHEHTLVYSYTLTLTTHTMVQVVVTGISAGLPGRGKSVFPDMSKDGALTNVQV